MLRCSHCHEYFKEGMHNVYFTDYKLSQFDGNWCDNCIEDIPDGVEMYVDGEHCMYEDGELDFIL